MRIFRRGSKSPRNKEEQQHLISTSPKKGESPSSPRGLFAKPSPRNRSDSLPPIIVTKIDYTLEERVELQKFFFSKHEVEDQSLPNEFNNKNFQKLIRLELGKPVHERYNSVQNKPNTSHQAFMSKMFEYAVQNMRLEYLICCLALYEIQARVMSLNEENIETIYPLIQFVAKNFFAFEASHTLNFGDVNKSFNNLTTQQIRQGWLEAVDQDYSQQDLLPLLKATQGLLTVLFDEYFPKPTATSTLNSVTLYPADLKNQYKLLQAFSTPIKLNPEDKYEIGIEFECVKIYNFDPKSICYQNYAQRENPISQDTDSLSPNHQFF